MYMELCSTYHADLALVDKHADYNCGQDAASHGVVGVDDGSVLAIACGQGSIEAGPE